MRLPLIADQMGSAEPRRCNGRRDGRHATDVQSHLANFAR
jgi:hypothetical protein